LTGAVRSGIISRIFEPDESKANSLGWRLDRDRVVCITDRQMEGDRIAEGGSPFVLGFAGFSLDRGGIAG